MPFARQKPSGESQESSCAAPKPSGLCGGCGEGSGGNPHLKTACLSSQGSPHLTNKEKRCVSFKLLVGKSFARVGLVTPLHHPSPSVACWSLRSSLAHTVSFLLWCLLLGSGWKHWLREMREECCLPDGGSWGDRVEEGASEQHHCEGAYRGCWLHHTLELAFESNRCQVFPGIGCRLHCGAEAEWGRTM